MLLKSPHPITLHIPPEYCRKSAKADSLQRQTKKSCENDLSFSQLFIFTDIRQKAAFLSLSWVNSPPAPIPLIKSKRRFAFDSQKTLLKNCKFHLLFISQNIDIMHSGTKKHTAIFYRTKPSGFCCISNLTL